MAEEGFQRARRPEQKRLRREAIMRAAAELLDERPEGALSLNAVARRVGLAKSNVYRYFESREQILLTILQEDLAGWGREVVERLEETTGRNSAGAAAAIFGETLGSRPRLCELMSLRGVVLERNLSEGTSKSWRETMAATVGVVGRALHRSLPSISEHRCVWAVDNVMGVVAGLWPQSGAYRPSPPSRDWAASAPPKTSWPQDLEYVVRALLYGLQVEGWRESGRAVGSRE